MEQKTGNFLKTFRNQTLLSEIEAAKHAPTERFFSSGDASSREPASFSAAAAAVREFHAAAATWRDAILASDGKHATTATTACHEYTTRASSPSCSANTAAASATSSSNTGACASRSARSGATSAGGDNHHHGSASKACSDSYSSEPEPAESSFKTGCEPAGL